jgi:hypothetical protein
MSGHLGFGRESKAGPPVEETQVYRIMPLGWAECDACGTVRPISGLGYVDCDADGVAIYRCAGSCEREPQT